MGKYIAHSEAETLALGNCFGRSLSGGSVVCFFGDLAAGKTTFIKGLATAFDIDSNQVASPTFAHLNIYQGSKTVYHFDLYRLRDADEFLSMGFDEYFFADGVCCVEWSERIAQLLPPDCIRVNLSHGPNNSRHIAIDHDFICF